MSEILGSTPGLTAPPAAEPRFLRRLLRSPVAIAALAFLLLVSLAAVFAPLIAPYGPTAGDLSRVNAGPSWAHPLGTDDLGRDVLTRILYGGRVTLLGALTAVSTACVVGVSGGLVAGYIGGRVDGVISRITEMAMAIPGIMMLLVVLSVFGSEETIAMVTFGLLVSPVLLRVVRASTLSVRNELFVDAARVYGLSRSRILLRHILPRVRGPIIVQLSLIGGSTVLVETGLGYLGLGAPPPTATWGSLVASASEQIHSHPWLLVPSGLVVAASVLSFGLLGDAVRDASSEVWQPNVVVKRRRNAARTMEVGVPGSTTSRRDALLEVRNLVVELRGQVEPVRVVDGVSFDLAPGETLGIVGESGCGKTMTARALIGLLPSGAYVAQGHCWFEGRDLAALDERALQRVRGSEIGLVSQNAIACLDPVFTISSQLGELVRIHEPRLSRASVRKRVFELLEMVNLPEPAIVARRYPHELSGGMAQRVAIAAAIAGRPKLLIADEPTTALDVTLQTEVLDLLYQLREQNDLAILLITHDWGVVADLCQRAVVMYAGQVVETATTSALFAQPLHPYTEALLRSNPQVGRARQRLTAIPGGIPAPDRWPTGCRFHPRCTYATTECALEAIPLVEPEAQRVARCIHSDELRAGAVRG